MAFDRLPSFLLSLCLHLGVLVLVIWWPASKPAPLPPKGIMIDAYFTLGAPGKSVPGARQAIPEAAKGRQEQAREVPKPVEQEQPKTVTRVENQTEVKPQPQAKPVEKAPPPVPEKSDAIPIPKEPEKPKAQEPEKPKTAEKPKEPEKTKESEKPAEKPKAKEPEKNKVDIDKELRDLARKTGTATGSRQGSGSAAGGKGKESGSGGIEKDLADLAKALGGSGTDAEGSGPGGSGGDGVGALGSYEQVIISRVRPNWSFPAQANRRQFSTLVNIQIAADGIITQSRILRSSGNAAYDASVLNALARTEQLEPPPNPDVMNIDIEFAF